MKNKVLIITSQHPSRPNGGAKILAERLKKLSALYDFYLLARDPDPDYEKNLDYIKKIFLIQKTRFSNVPVLLYRYFIKTGIILYSLVLKHRIKIIQIEFYENLVYSLLLLPLKITGAKFHYTVIDIQSQYHEPGTLRYTIVKSIEYLYFRFFIDYIYVWGDDDEAEICSWGIDKKKIVIIPPVFSDISTAKKWKENSAMDFLFIGSYDHVPNRDTIDFIITNLWDDILKIYPDSKLFLVTGRNGSQLHIDKPNVINLGFVDSVYNVMKTCNIMLAPMISGTGIKVKIVESFGYGIPVISTSIGFRNFINLDREKCLIADTSSGIIDKIIKIKNNKLHLSEISAYQLDYFKITFSENNYLLYNATYGA